MAGLIQVTPAKLRSKAEELKGLNSKLQSEISNLQSQESSLNSMWDGEANDAFHAQFSKDIVQMNNFHTLIEQYVQTLNQISTEYERAEKTNLSTASTRKY